jgi:hypothetical protein
MLYLSVTVDKVPLGRIARIASFAPFLFIISWPYKYQTDTYALFRKIVIFFSIGSSITILLSFLNVLQYIPYYQINAQSMIHENHGYVYHMYGFFVTLYDQTGIVQRTCGFLQEPGHFAILLGCVHLADRLLKRKINLWIVLCGLLTFSSNFILIAGIGEIYDMITNGNFMRNMKRYVSVVIITLLCVFILPQEIREQIVYLAYERNVEEVFDSFSDSGTLIDALDERANSTGRFYYDQLMASGNYFFGTSSSIDDDSFVLSDYRGLILTVGLVGVLFSILLSYVSVSFVPWKVRIALMSVFILVLIHRSWMLIMPYIYFLIFMVATVYKNNRICSLKYS